MNTRRIVITGATSGIGLETARELARRGDHLILACRNIEKAERVRDELLRDELARDAGAIIDLAHLDLADLDSVRECAGRIRSDYAWLTCLVNNAGTFAMDRRETADGFELTMGTNHLGPFLLTSLLLPLLRSGAPARVVNVASAAYRYGALRLDDLQRRRWRGGVGWGGFRSYAASRLATVLFTAEFARRVDSGQVTANCCHPGHVATNIFPKAGGLMGKVMEVTGRFRISAAEGAVPVVRLATDEVLTGTSGVYFNRFDAEPLSRRAADEMLARGLWDASVELTGAHW